MFTSTRYDVGDYNETLCRLHQKRSVQNAIHRISRQQQQTAAHRHRRAQASNPIHNSNAPSFPHVFVPFRHRLCDDAHSTHSRFIRIYLVSQSTVLLQCSTLAIVCVRFVTNVFLKHKNKRRCSHIKLSVLPKRMVVMHYVLVSFFFAFKIATNSNIHSCIGRKDSIFDANRRSQWYFEMFRVEKCAQRQLNATHHEPFMLLSTTCDRQRKKKKHNDYAYRQTDRQKHTILCHHYTYETRSTNFTMELKHQTACKQRRRGACRPIHRLYYKLAMYRRYSR